MRKFILISWILSTCLGLFAIRAGVEWSYQLMTNENRHPKKILVLPDSTISVLRTLEQDDNYVLNILRLTSDGEYIEDIETQINGQIYIMDVVHSPGYYLVVCESIIYKITESGLMIWENSYEELGAHSFISATITTNGTYLIGGTSGYGWSQLILELTHQGHLIWNDTHLTGCEQAYVSSIIEIGNLYFGAGMIGVAAGPDYAVHGNVLRYDVSGNYQSHSWWWLDNFQEYNKSKFLSKNENVWLLNNTKIFEIDSYGGFSNDHEFGNGYSNGFVTNEGNIWLQSSYHIAKYSPNSQYQELARYETDYIVEIAGSLDDKPIILRRVGSDPLQNIDVYIEKIDENLTSDEDISLESFQNSLILTNYPNPFNPTTTISYSLAKAQKVELEIYNIRGQLIRTLFKSKLPVGKSSVVWNGTDESNNPVSSGIYFSRLKTDEGIQSRKLMLIK